MQHTRTLAAIFCLQLSISISLSAQITGGQHVFTSLSLSPSARITALGGAQIAVQDEDISFALANPAALTSKMDGRLTFNHNFFLSDIQFGNFAFGKTIPKIGMNFHAALRYLNYGEIKRADEFGVVNGKVKAGETAFTLGASRQLSGKITLGLNLHLANARLDEFRAGAIAADAGIFFADTASRFTAALVLKNYGTQLGAFAETREDLPNDIQFALSKRLKYLPFRLTMIAHHLHTWDIRYDDPNAEDDEIFLFGEDQSNNKDNPALDNFFRHLIFNGEFLLGKNEVFRLRFGYNHLRKRELTVRNYRSLAGFSGGFGVRIRKFRVDMGYASYHLAGGVVHFSLGAGLNDFLKK